MTKLLLEFFSSQNPTKFGKKETNIWLIKLFSSERLIGLQDYARMLVKMMVIWRWRDVVLLKMMVMVEKDDGDLEMTGCGCDT